MSTASEKVTVNVVEATDDVALRSTGAAPSVAVTPPSLANKFVERSDRVPCVYLTSGLAPVSGEGRSVKVRNSWLSSTPLPVTTPVTV